MRCGDENGDRDGEMLVRSEEERGRRVEMVTGEMVRGRTLKGVTDGRA